MEKVEEFKRKKKEGEGERERAALRLKNKLLFEPLKRPEPSVHYAPKPARKNKVYLI